MTLPHHTKGKGTLLGSFLQKETQHDQTTSKELTMPISSPNIQSANRIMLDSGGTSTTEMPSESTYQSGFDLLADFLCNGNSTEEYLNDTNFYRNILCTNESSVQNFTNVTGNNSQMSGIGSDESSAFDSEYRYWVLILVIFPLLTVFGNVLVVMSIYRERSLRTATNYFICSLAVADIMVAVCVMPPAVYLEVTRYWLLSDVLCDAWVASDVLACTASILNLTAISVDRFIAVTQPIKYLKHKNSKRVFVTLALTWVISVAIAAPIALGVNYSVWRSKGLCAFFNSDFLIYSSMGSFYIPSIIMIFLYWRIYRVLHLRAQAAIKSKQAKHQHKKNIANVIENSATVNAALAEPSATTHLNTAIDNGKISTYNTNKCPTASSLPISDDASVNVNSDSSDRYMDDGSGLKSPGSMDGIDDEIVGALIVNPVAVRHVEIQIDGNGNGTCVAETQTDDETNFSKTDSNKTKTVLVNDHSCLIKNSNSLAVRKPNQHRRKDKRGLAKFNFHMRTSRKRKEKSSTKKERKATKTLAIVLGVFLICWVPFFTINIMNAICFRYDGNKEQAVCDIEPILYSVFSWLGYMNSSLNPVIYTIFNPEFRKAFKRILTGKCCP